MARVLAKRYAQAVFQIALESGELEGWKKGLNRLKEVLLNPDLLPILENPRFSVKEKASIIKGVIRDVNPMVLNLARLLISKGRIRLIEDVLKEYEKLVFKHYSIEVAELITAVSLDGAEEKLVEERVGQVLGKKLKLSYRVDPGILGGVVVRGEDWLFDGSLKNKLQSLGERLLREET